MRKIKTAPLLPTKFEIEEVNEREINIRVSPFESGMAISIAHPLKRLLMNSTIGYSAVAIKVENASHEFDNISGMLEDISELIINLKSIRFKLKDGLERAEVSYSFKGSKEIYGADLENNEVGIVTPKSFLATLNEDGQLDFKLIIYQGMGYVPSEDIRATILENEYDNYIPLDAYFTPIRKANYKIDNILVDDDPNFEAVTFNIVTDGQISPKEALSYTLATFDTQLGAFKKINSDAVEPMQKIFLPLEETNVVVDEKEIEEELEVLTKEEEDIVNKLLMEIKDIPVKQRVANTLISHGYKYTGDVVFLDDRDLKELKHFGQNSVVELNAALDKQQLDKAIREELSDKIKKEFERRRKINEETIS